MKVSASDVQEGDFLLGGQVYVFQDAEEVDNYHNAVRIGRDYSVGANHDNYVLINFHDNDGEEGYLVMVGSSQVEVTRGAPV